MLSVQFAHGVVPSTWIQGKQRRASILNFKLRCNCLPRSCLFRRFYYGFHPNFPPKARSFSFILYPLSLFILPPILFVLRQNPSYTDLQPLKARKRAAMYHYSQFSTYDLFHKDILHNVLDPSLKGEKHVDGSHD